MGSLSPVIAAFLAGQRGQTDILENANQIINQREARKLQQQHIDEIIKQHEQENQRSIAQHELQQQIYKLNYQKALIDHQNDTRAQFLSGERQLEGTNFQMPGAATVQPTIPGAPLDIQPGTPRNVFTPDETQYVESPFGVESYKTSSLGTQATKNKEHLEALMATLPFEISKAGGIAKAQEDIKMPGRIKLLEDKLASNEGIWSDRLAKMEALTKLRIASADEIAESRASRSINDMFLRMGFPGGEAEMRRQSIQHARDRAVGKEDPNVLKGQALNNRVENDMKDLGLSDLPGGAKTRQGLFGIFDTTLDLMNQADNLVKDFPAPTSWTSQIGQLAASKNPLSKISKAYSEYRTNLVNFARSKGITNQRLMDSDTEKKTISNGMVTETDTPADVETKKLHLVSGALNSFQSQVSSLPKETRKDIWIDAIKAHPSLWKDPKYEKIWDEIFDTGIFRPESFNKLLPSRR